MLGKGPLGRVFCGRLVRSWIVDPARGSPNANSAVAMDRFLLLACLLGAARGQSQCSQGYLSQVNSLCCAGPNGQDTCHGGEPTRW